jgi:hypothetical protein
VQVEIFATRNMFSPVRGRIAAGYAGLQVTDTANGQGSKLVNVTEIARGADPCTRLEHARGPDDADAAQSGPCQNEAGP